MPNLKAHPLIASFEHSLVDELGYNGYERLRRGFNRAYGGEENVPTFQVVVDAGCGTGLVGEQVRMTSCSQLKVQNSSSQLGNNSFGMSARISLELI